MKFYVMADLDRCKRCILLSAIGTLLIFGTLIFMSIPIKEYMDILRLTRGEIFQNIKDVSAIITQSVTTDEVEEIKTQYLNHSNTVNTSLSFCNYTNSSSSQVQKLHLKILNLLIRHFFLTIEAPSYQCQEALFILNIILLEFFGESRSEPLTTWTFVPYY